MTDAGPFPAPEERLCLRPAALLPGNRVLLLRDGAEAYPRMLEAIRRAERSVFLEMYIFADDPVGQRFARALAGRVRAGVDVRVVYDSAGSRDSAREFFGWMRSQGVKVLEFHPIHRSFHGFRFRRRNHRKLLVVDGRVAFVGGLNIGREYAAPADGGLGWRDTQVELKGPVVAPLARTAEVVWRQASRRKEAYRIDVVPAPPQEGGLPALVVSSLQFRTRWEIGKHYLHAIRRARERVWIANSYFLPSLTFRRELRRAARRGVDVRLLVPRQTDFPPVLYATRNLFARYLAWGVRVFEWQGPMMHAKTAVVDGAWSTVGSYNLDHLSLLHNFELTAILAGRDFGARMERMFEEDLAGSREIRPDEWRRRGWASRLAEQACYLFRLLM